MRILATSASAVQYMYHRTKGKTPGQLLFVRDMIPPINHVVDWRYIRQRKKMKINKGLNRKNTTRIDYYSRVGDKVMTNMRSEYK